jgi:hypothetical protein
MGHCWTLLGCAVGLSLCMTSCSSKTETIAEGAERGVCYPNGTCNAGLSCFSNHCVSYDAAISSGAGGANTGGSGNPDHPDASMGGFGGGAGSNTDGMSPGTGGGSMDGGETDDVSSRPDARDASGDAVLAEASDSGATVDASADSDDGAPACSQTFSIGACNGFLPPPNDRTQIAQTAPVLGTIDLTVSGVLVFPGYVIDGFYQVDVNDNSVAVGAFSSIAYNLDFEGCLCAALGCTVHRLTAALVGPYPAFSATHEYKVQLSLGSGHSIGFALEDCFCRSQTGSFTLTVAPAEGVSCNQ